MGHIICEFTVIIPSHKLQPRLIQCVFLGYSLLQKGYKCLHLPSGHVYFSRDVLFNEDVFTFARPCSTNFQSMSTSDLNSLQVQSSTMLHAATPLSVGPPPFTSATLTSFADNESPQAHSETLASPQLLAHPSSPLPHSESLPSHISPPRQNLLNSIFSGKNQADSMRSKLISKLDSFWKSILTNSTSYKNQFCKSVEHLKVKFNKLNFH